MIVLLPAQTTSALKEADHGVLEVRQSMEPGP